MVSLLIMAVAAVMPSYNYKCNVVWFSVGESTLDFKEGQQFIRGIFTALSWRRKKRKIGKKYKENTCKCAEIF